jgi:hypothetical protein
VIKTHEENRLVLDLKLKLAHAEYETQRVKLEYYRLHKELDNLKAEQMDPEMLKILTLLCHPDKHNNSPAAEKAIKYLLKLRKK